MKLLLDTQSLVWWFNDDPKLGPKVRSLISDSQSVVQISSVSLWEISIKYRIGKMDDLGSVMFDEAKASGFGILDIEQAHLEKLEDLPINPTNKDPFDNMILAQAIVEDAVLITSDRHLLTSGSRVLRAK